MYFEPFLEMLNFSCNNVSGISIYELNQIGIKIDMYRQEYRFTPAFAFIQAV